jgi:hypothetical protein
MANSVLPAVGLRANVVQAAHAAMIASAGADYTPNGKTVNGFDGSGFLSYVLQRVFPAYKHLDTAISNMVKQSTFVHSKLMREKEEDALASIQVHE